MKYEGLESYLDLVICLVYVDDTLFFLPREEYIDKIIQKLCNDDMELEVESCWIPGSQYDKQQC